MADVFIFEFEKNNPHIASLEWIPLCVRYYLDATQKKLSLGSWQSFPMEIRQQFVDFTLTEENFNLPQFVELLVAANTKYNGSQLKEVELQDPAIWNTKDSVPPHIQEQCSAFYCSIPLEDWCNFSPFLKYTFHKATTGRDGSILPKLLKELHYINA